MITLANECFRVTKRRATSFAAFGGRTGPPGTEAATICLGAREAALGRRGGYHRIFPGLNRRNDLRSALEVGEPSGCDILRAGHSFRF